MLALAALAQASGLDGVPGKLILQTLLAMALGGYFFIKSSQRRHVPPTPESYCQPDESTAKPGHGAVYRIGPFPKPEFASMLEMLQASVRKFPTKQFLGHRPIDSAGNAGPFVWETYEECYERIQNFAAGLMHQRMVEEVDGMRLLCIYMKNRPEWTLAQYASYYCGAGISPLYDTLGVTSTKYILNQTLAATVLCTTLELPGLLSMKADVASMTHIILADVKTASEADKAAAAAANVQLWTFAQIEELGAKYPMAPRYPKADDTSILMYTSGTTGDPKGVVLTHANMLVTNVACDERVTVGKAVAAVHNHPTFLSYLPLPHVAEQIFQLFMIRHYGSLGFYQGNTAKILDDLLALRPTIFATVPRLLNRIYDKIVGGAAAAGGFKSWLFQKALDAKLANLPLGITTHWLYDKLIFSKIRVKLGLDRATLLGCGSAPLSPDVLAFFRIVMDCPVLEAYGQSECSGLSNMTHYLDFTGGNAGPPLANCEIKLVSVPEMGYDVNDTEHGDDEDKIAVRGRGEVCYRGPNVFPGYYKNPEKTKEALDEDGWLHSGDVGVWLPDGRLKIIDRKKNIFKLSQGEYVAPEKIELVVKGSAYVNQPFVYGDSLHAVLVAIVVPEEEELTALAKSLGVAGSFAELCAHPSVVAAVLKDIVAVSKRGGLYGFETVRAIALHPEPFTVENDMMTPTFKLKRNDVKKAFIKEIDELYAKSGDVVAGKNVKQH
ncbi:Long-chain-fatty-acid--CoA ligase [Achlya hypogyna]|uniref:Long-chain-fatty-acid--CoA ligase n=1 Tax=Achlya hypogyna TaxID=1202772 RepID=A0A1V9ZGN5_ACHHY|nr:Long-chain-fatty-acid--CoA ligase [Achlya hypogyna]